MVLAWLGGIIGRAMRGDGGAPIELGESPAFPF